MMVLAMLVVSDGVTHATSDGDVTDGTHASTTTMVLMVVIVVMDTLSVLVYSLLHAGLRYYY